MNIFGNIMSAIFGHSAVQAQPKPSTGNTAAAPSASSAPTSASTAPQSKMDVEAVLNKRASQNREKLDWRKYDCRSHEAPRA
jgi:uncharacterized protein DUF3597